MPRDVQADDAVVLRFGGGIRSRASEDEIDLREAASGQNFDLDLQNRTFRNRKPIDLIGTAPNDAEIRGFITLQKIDGSISTLVQAGDKVYQIDSNFAFTEIATVSSSAKLRGRLSHAWELDDLVIVTDLNLAEEVRTWDGTNLTAVTFTKNDGSTAWTGEFRAKYCTVDSERVMFANVHDNSSDFPHLIVGSKRGEFSIISNDQRPSSALGEDDPFFLIQPDFRPINGFIGAFNTVVSSSRSGAMFKLTGDSAQDFAFEGLYPRSGAFGNESVVYVGNDIHYGRQGRIESLASTDRFGDVETNDLTEDMADQIITFSDWTAAYNERLQRVYFLPDGENQLWVLHKSLIGLGLSPWSKWTTTSPVNMVFTTMMNVLDPNDGLEYVWAGDASGNVYRIEGTGLGDLGFHTIRTERLSGLFKAPLDAQAYDIEGWVLYRKKAASVDLRMRFEYVGDSVFNEEITETLAGDTGGDFFGGDAYFGGDNYFGSPFAGKLTRRRFGVAGRSTEFQLRLSAESTNDFEIAEVGIRFSAAS